jgi:hypothetical protein
MRGFARAAGRRIAWSVRRHNLRNLGGRYESKAFHRKRHYLGLRNHCLGGSERAFRTHCNHLASPGGLLPLRKSTQAAPSHFVSGIGAPHSCEPVSHS